MVAWRWIRNLLGLSGVAVVIGVTVVTALIAAVVAPRLLPASERAEARVSMTQVTGSRASYELATFVADFQTALASDPVRRGAADAAGVTVSQVDAGLTTERLGESSTVLVGFVAGSGKSAEAGLRAAVRQGLAGLVGDARRRSDLELRAALSQQREVLAAVGKADLFANTRIPKEYRKLSRDFMVQHATEVVANASGQSVLVQTEANSLGDIMKSQPVSVQRLATTSAEVRIVLAAAVTSFLLALGGVLLARRYRPQSGSPASRARDRGTASGRHAEVSPVASDTQPDAGPT